MDIIICDKSFITYLILITDCLPVFFTIVIQLFIQTPKEFVFEIRIWFLLFNISLKIWTILKKLLGCFMIIQGCKSSTAYIFFCARFYHHFWWACTLNTQSQVQKKTIFCIHLESCSSDGSQYYLQLMQMILKGWVANDQEVSKVGSTYSSPAIIPDIYS